MAFRTGKDGTVVLNGNELPITDWDVSSEATIATFVNSKTGKHPSRQPTFIDGGQFGFNIDWDDANNIFGAPYTVGAGTVLTNTKLMLDGAAGSRFWSYPSAVVQRVSQTDSVTGKIITRVTCLADGAFAPPGQAVA